MKLRDFGLLEYDPSQATYGITVLVPNRSPDAYLIGMRGEVLHHWTILSKTSGHALLLSSGNLLVAQKADPKTPTHREQLRLVGEYDWDGSRVWHCEAPGHGFHGPEGLVGAGGV